MIKSVLTATIGVLLAASGVAALWFVLTLGHGEPSAPPPSPSPSQDFCQQINKDLAVTDAGGQIAPVCGNTPYPYADQVGDSDG